MLNLIWKPEKLDLLTVSRTRNLGYRGSHFEKSRAPTMFLSKYLQCSCKNQFWSSTNISNHFISPSIFICSRQCWSVDMWRGKTPPKNTVGQWNGKSSPLEIQISHLVLPSLLLESQIPRTLEGFLWLVLNDSQMQESACFVEMLCTLKLHNVTTNDTNAETLKQTPQKSVLQRYIY